MAARSITSILSKAPNQGAIPYHRIVYASGKVWFSPEHEKIRRALYKREGISVNKKSIVVNFDDIRYEFPH
jgi:alkylated DNA nucleotide flippase Atl1